MIAAVYARKSTDQGGVSDEDRSVSRQVDHPRRYAERKGWTVAAACIFADDGVSGAEFAKRPGFVRLMSALKPRPPFDVLIMSEESRLGREQIETAYALKLLMTSGVRVFFYLEDRERTLDGPMDKLLLSVTAFADELEREKARAGHVTGGRVFGYDNVEILGAPDAGGRRVRQRVERQVNQLEAAVVRRIFALCAEGAGQSRIAKTLNAEGARAPRPQQGRPQSWAPSSVREVLYRSLYCGEIVWNRTQKRNQWGRVEPRNRPESAWLRQSADELRNVSKELWEAAHARLEDRRARYLEATGGRAWGRPRDLDSKYLLSDLARCGLCGGGLIVRSRSHGKLRAFLYACGSYHQRGPAACSNRAQLPIGLLDREVLDQVAALMTPDILAAAVDAALELLTSAPTPVETIERMRDELRAVDAETGRLTLAIAHGGEIDTLVGALKAASSRAEAIRQAIARQVAPPAPGTLKAALAARAAEWRDVLRGEMNETRQMLRKILAGPIVCRPARQDREGWAVKRAAALDSVFPAEIAGPRFLASPTGFTPFTARGAVGRVV